MFFKYDFDLVRQMFTVYVCNFVLEKIYTVLFLWSMHQPVQIRASKHFTGIL